jgi:hypothetical protein
MNASDARWKSVPNLNCGNESCFWVVPPDFDYGFSPPDPAPADGCMMCAAFVEQRNAERSTGNRSAATDVNILMRKHLHRDH